MQDLLQQIDADYYRSALLLIVRAELERIRQGQLALADVDRQSKTASGKSGAASSSIRSLEPLPIV
jgi:hypothetical protein